MIDVQKCLVVGSGSIARRHISILRFLLPNSEVACVSASGRLLSAGETSATHHLASLADAIAWRPNLAVIASPAPLHPRHAAAFLEVGAAVLIEKPLADSCSRFNELAPQLCEHHSRIEIAYNLRYLPALVELKNQIDRKVIGRLHSIRIEVGQYLPDWRPHTNYRHSVSANKLLGGGVLLELSHELDYLRWIFGKFDTGYCILSNSGQLQIDVEDRVDIMLSRSDGVVVQIHMDFLQRKVSRDCKVIGETGSLYLDFVTNSLRIFRDGKEEVLFSNLNADSNDMYIEQMRGFIQLATGQVSPRIPLDDGISILTLIELLRQSAATGLPVSMEPAFPK